MSFCMTCFGLSGHHASMPVHDYGALTGQEDDCSSELTIATDKSNTLNSNKMMRNSNAPHSQGVAESPRSALTGQPACQQQPGTFSVAAQQARQVSLTLNREQLLEMRANYMDSPQKGSSPTPLDQVTTSPKGATAVPNMTENKSSSRVANQLIANQLMPDSRSPSVCVKEGLALSDVRISYWQNTAGLGHVQGCTENFKDLKVDDRNNSILQQGLVIVQPASQLSSKITKASSISTSEAHLIRWPSTDVKAAILSELYTLPRYKSASVQKPSPRQTSDEIVPASPESAAGSTAAAAVSHSCHLHTPVWLVDGRTRLGRRSTSSNLMVIGSNKHSVQQARVSQISLGTRKNVTLPWLADKHGSMPSLSSLVAGTSVANAAATEGRVQRDQLFSSERMPSPLMQLPHGSLSIQDLIVKEVAPHKLGGLDARTSQCGNVDAAASALRLTNRNASHWRNQPEMKMRRIAHLSSLVDVSKLSGPPSLNRMSAFMSSRVSNSLPINPRLTSAARVGGSGAHQLLSKEQGMPLVCSPCMHPAHEAGSRTVLRSRSSQHLVLKGNKPVAVSILPRKSSAASDCATAAAAAAASGKEDSSHHAITSSADVHSRSELKVEVQPFSMVASTLQDRHKSRSSIAAGSSQLVGGMTLKSSSSTPSFRPFTKLGDEEPQLLSLIGALNSSDLEIHVLASAASSPAEAHKNVSPTAEAQPRVCMTHHCPAPLSIISSHDTDITP
ncbi:hypothetical protein CEUSTIGMA_g7947.t1 [Chlamydomonas eustigma]|uniref:Uncharacterized protein n=1 Tax=Chlamydomonas eustigma TaxID=1157962 RepID=A0A250XC97_9CHLO|nr:hypothetical protein CEUSTIGMA_g7947.t1 [Chlamydomonas eustigma]|eukprot:GAX80509.1 hypothetical protein CEUSTIGMA_g7947.t1 [Chlamydomonas eustigma]